MGAEVLIVLTLATWRVSYMLTSESGAFGMFDTLRFYAKASQGDCQSGSGSVLCCMYCTSVWVAPVMMALTLHAAGLVLLYILAISAASILVQSFNQWLRRF